MTTRITEDILLALMQLGMTDQTMKNVDTVMGGTMIDCDAASISDKAEE